MDDDAVFMFVANIVMDDDELEAIEYLIEDSGERNEPNRADHARNLNYFEETIPQYSLDDFKNHFRMSRLAFEVRFSI